MEQNCTSRGVGLRNDERDGKTAVTGEKKHEGLTRPAGGLKQGGGT